MAMTAPHDRRNLQKTCDGLYPHFSKITCILTVPSAPVEQFLRAIWNAVSQAAVLILPQTKLNSQLFMLCIFRKSAPLFSSVTVTCDSLRPHRLQHTGLPVHHSPPESTQTHVHRVGDAIQPSHPLSSTSPPAFNLSQHQGLFKWVSYLHQVDLDTPQIFHSKLHLFLGGSGGVLELAWLARTADCQILGVWAGCQTRPLLKIKLCKFTIN